MKESGNKKNSYAIVVIICAFILNFASNYPQYQLSPMAHIILPTYNIDVAQFSSLFSASMISGILLGIVAGVLCDKFGAKTCIGIAAIISLVGVVGRIFASNYTVLFLCMVISGLGNTFLNSNLAKIMGSWFAPERIGMAVGISLAGSTTAMAVAMSTTAMLPSLSMAFIIAAVVSVIAIVVWFALMKNRPSQMGDINNIDLPTTSVKDGLVAVTKNKYIWIVGLCVGLTLAASMIINTFLPQALQSVRGFDAVSAGAMSSAVMFGTLAGAIFGPAICAKIGRMKVYLFVFCLIAAVGVALAWQAPSGIALIIALFITGFVASGLIAQFTSIPVMLSGVGPALAGAAGGFVGTIQILCGVVLPSYVFAPIVGDNFVVLFIIGGALMLVAGIMTFAIPELLGKPKEESNAKVIAE